MTHHKEKQDKNTNWGSPGAMIVDRGAGDLRRGLPVVVYSGDLACAIIACEGLTDQACQKLTEQQRELPDGAKLGVLISDKRAQTLKIPTKGRGAILIDHDPLWNSEAIRAIADPTLDLGYPLKGPFIDENLDHIDAERSALERDALKLLKIANLLPAGLCLMHERAPTLKLFKEQGILCLDAESVGQYEQNKLVEMEEVVRTTVPLDEANNTTVVSFRPRSGGVENLAIIINNPDTSKPVLTRLHSECFTGDLLGSLKCDCGSQLKGAIAEIEKAGSGVLLYLAQEGRGVGLSAKLKAYTLQEQGFDTVDSNLRLGFEVDERVYAPAAKILKMLNISAIKLMTNNPKKVDALKKFDIEVVKRVSHHFPTNKHNEAYVQTKKDRTGHLSD